MSQDALGMNSGAATACRLCFRSRIEDGEWNTPLIESSHFIVLPSLGALVEGWVLIVPKEHAIAMAALPTALFGELHSLTNFTRYLIADIYGDAVVFEHGPSRDKRAVGCGVDHAHLHIVPIAFDLAKAAAPFLPCGARWKAADAESCRKAHDAGIDYLYIEQHPGHGKIISDRAIGSQVFRRTIAREIGCSEQYSWREHPQLDKVAATREAVIKAVKERPLLSKTG